MSADTAVAIIGGGFSGAVTAVQLAGKVTRPCTIHVVEPRPVLGSGVAYSAADPAHRINVPARRMSVFVDDPEHFDRWVRARSTLCLDPAALWSDGSAFPQRAIFGQYVAELVAEAAHANPGVTIRHHRDVATDLTARTDGFTVRLRSGEALSVQVAILAVSHPPPALPSALRPLQDVGAPLVADPWRVGALDDLPVDANVLVVGTGLTMADVVATLDRRGHRGSILAVSRRGLLSRGHAFGPVAKRSWFETSASCRTALQLTRAVRAQAREAVFNGQPWQAVFDDVRVNAGRLWAALDVIERRRLVRHIRPFWDVHRFRVAPQAESAIARLRAAGRFQSLAASLLGASWDGHKIQVHLKPRRTVGGQSIVVEIDAVVVTTGPAHTGAIVSNPVLASLAGAGLIRPDQVGLGLDVDRLNRAVGLDGSVRPGLLVVGPLARGRVGELMGLPQVSEHAEAVADVAADLLRLLPDASSRAAANAAGYDVLAAAFPPI